MYLKQKKYILKLFGPLFWDRKVKDYNGSRNVFAYNSVNNNNNNKT